MGAWSDLVVISYVSCVGRGSILIAIPLSLVVCKSYSNRPGATLLVGPAWIPTRYCGKVSSWTGLL